MERHSRHQDREENQRPHDPKQRDARSFHGEQLQILAHIAESNQRGQKKCQRQSLWNKRETHIPEETSKDIQRQALSHQIVNVAPGELHHVDEETHAEGRNEELKELRQDKRVDALDLQEVKRVLFMLMGLMFVQYSGE